MVFSGRSIITIGTIRVMGTPLRVKKDGNSGYEGLFSGKEGHPFGLRRTVIRVMGDITLCRAKPVKGWPHTIGFKGFFKGFIGYTGLPFPHEIMKNIFTK